MALYQELHRRASVQALVDAGATPPNLLGRAFARYFVRVVQHDPPTTLDDLRAELRAETCAAHPDYRASDEILSRSLAESGLDDLTYSASLARHPSPDLRCPLAACSLLAAPLLTPRDAMDRSLA
jgi:hypothetical protein